MWFSFLFYLQTKSATFCQIYAIVSVSLEMNVLESLEKWHSWYLTSSQLQGLG